MKKTTQQLHHTSRGFAHMVALMAVLVGTATVGSYLLVKSHADSVSGASGTSTGGSGPNYHTVIYGSALGNVLACKSGGAVRFQTSIYTKPAKEEFWFDSGKSLLIRHWSGGVFKGSLPIPASVSSFNAKVEKSTDTASHVAGTPLSSINKC